MALTFDVIDSTKITDGAVGTFGLVSFNRPMTNW